MRTSLQSDQCWWRIVRKPIKRAQHGPDGSDDTEFLYFFADK